MEKTFKFICLLLFITPYIFLTSSCSDDDDNNKNSDKGVPLVLDRTDVALIQGKSISITIDEGNGDYVVSSSNNNVAAATVNDNVITISSTTKEDRAEAIIFITDKMKKNATIQVLVTKTLDLTVETNLEELQLGVEGKDQAIIKIKTGNFGYKVSIDEASKNTLEVDTTGLEYFGKFSVKSLLTGIGKIKVSDSAGKEITVEIPISTPHNIILDKASIELDAVQGNDKILVTTGNGDYSVSFADSRIAFATVEDNEITITGKMNGSTTLTVKDRYGKESEKVKVTVNGPAYAMNLGTEYFCFATFKDLAAVDMSIKKCEQVTFEITCNMKGYRGLQTFMGLEGKLIMRGKNDSHINNHPIEIAGLGDKIMMLSTSSFNLNEWMHLAFVVDCSQSDVKEKYKLYINGVQDELKFTRTDETHSSVDLTSSNDGDRFEIGRASGQDWRAMNGMVSEARVWKVARTAQQIKDNICTLKEEDPKGLLTRWDFTAGCNTNYIQDSNGGTYQTNLKIAKVSPGSNYDQIEAPKSVFVSKGCP